MTKLIGLQGEHKGKTFTLAPEEPFHLGREKGKCQLTFRSSSISRLHASIYRQGEHYFIVDEGSHNGTYVDQTLISGTGPQRLENGAKIRLCGNELEFRGLDQSSSFTPEEFSSTVEVLLSHKRDYHELRSARKLAWLLELTAELSKTLDVHQALPNVMDQIFTLFPIADRVLLFLKPEGGNDGELTLTESRTSPQSAERGYSNTLLQQCLTTGNGLVAENARKLGEDLGAASVIMSRIHSVMCAPIQGRRGASLGALHLDIHTSNDKFSEEDLQLLMAVAQQIATALEQAADHRSLVAFESIKQELIVAKKIQRGLLPQQVPQSPIYDFAAFYESAREVGGDYYDLIELPGGKIAILQGDVAGKGVPAALFMARMSAAASYAIKSEATLSSAFARLNKLAMEMSNFHRFLTLVAAILDPEEHTITFVNAAHTIPLLCSSEDGRAQEVMCLDQLGLPLGLSEESTYPEHRISFPPGSTLVMFTDGLTDSLDTEGRAFGKEGILHALSHPGCNATELLDNLVRAVEIHTEGCEQFDDTTITCVGRI